MRGDPAWERDFRKAQSVRTVVINSKEYERIAYGDEERFPRSLTNHLIANKEMGFEIWIQWFRDGERDCVATDLAKTALAPHLQTVSDEKRWKLVYDEENECEVLSRRAAVDRAGLSSRGRA